MSTMHTQAMTDAQGRHVISATGKTLAHTVSSVVPDMQKESAANAKLFSAAWNSYQRNYGERALEFAQDDAIKSLLLALSDVFFKIDSVVSDDEDVCAYLSTLQSGISGVMRCHGFVPFMIGIHPSIRKLRDEADQAQADVPKQDIRKGLRPRWVVDELRECEVRKAIIACETNSVDVPQEWRDELAQLEESNEIKRIHREGEVNKRHIRAFNALSDAVEFYSGTFSESVTLDDVISIAVDRFDDIEAIRDVSQWFNWGPILQNINATFVRGSDEDCDK